jgi:CRISPR/Cas system CMR subunit Cmr4 (Cas7 group RAMP superfamily)
MFRFSTPLLKEKYEKRISENSQLQKSIGITEFHNRIKRDTLVAKQGALFSREVGPEVFEYAGKISQIRACSSEQKLDRYLSFLICGMRFVTHIGGNRRRGKGLARLEIEKVYDKNNEKIIDYRSLIKKGLSE